MTARGVLPLCLALATPLLAQNPPASHPVTFDVVSVKRHLAESGLAALNFNVAERPDGGLTMINVPVAVIIGRAYGLAPVNMVGLPAWAGSERYDLSATASLQRVSAEQRAGMLRAALADRFKLAVHVEQREQATFDLLVARKDGTLGPAIRSE